MLAASEPRAASAVFRQAEGQWQGTALSGLPGEAIARVRRGLEEERRAVTAQRIECDLAAGCHSGLIAELQQLSAARPLDQSLIAQLMLALFRSGRQSDALAVYRDTRERHIRELGTEPGDALAELHMQMLRGDPALTAKPIPRSGTLISPSAPDTLPPRAREFTGRAAELEQLTACHGGTYVITGMPGVGKTALALQAAHALRERFPDGRLFLCLSTHDLRHPPIDTDEALHHLLSMLGVPLGRIPHALPERAALWRAELARRRVLAILDDVAGPDQVQPLLPADGASMVLITSRTRLPGVAATVMMLAVLAADESANLFTKVTGSVRAGTGAQVARVVGLCGGLPLAIQLLARRVRASGFTTVGELVNERLAARSDRSGQGVPSAEVATAFELSYQALASGSRRLFRSLGLHPGTDITERTAAVLAGVPLPEAGAALADLLNRHLLEPAGKYFRFHDLIRHYAAGRAQGEDSAADRRAALDRLLGYYLRTVDQADRVLRPHAREIPGAAPLPPGAPDIGSPAQARSWLELEWRSILQTARYAAAHERKPQCARLIHALGDFLVAAGHWKQAAEAHRLALQACRDTDDTGGVARASLDLSLVAGQAGDLPAAFRHAEQAAAIFKSLADWTGLAETLDQLGTLHRFASRYREALAYHQEASELYRRADDRHGIATTLNNTALVCYHLGRYPEALSRVNAALEQYRQAGDRRGEAVATGNLGSMQRYRGYHRDAMASYARALEIFQEIGGEMQKQAQLRENIACIHLYKRDYDSALACFRDALAMFRRIGDLPGEGSTLNEIGETLTAMDDPEGALEHHQQAADIAADLGDSYGRAIALRGMADALRGSGRHGDATDRYQQARRLAREISDPLQEGKALDGLAATALQTQDTAMARIYWRQALDIFQQLGAPEAEEVSLRLETIPPVSAH